MGRKLVTIATFDQPAQARLALNALEAAGVRGVVSDETVVAMDWLLSNAVGGIKVQVWEEDADRAVGVLEGALGPDERVDPDELAAEAEAAPPEDREPTGSRRVPPTVPADEAPTISPTSRDAYSRSLFIVGWLGLGFPPLWFYAVYLFLNAAFGAGPLSRRGRFELIVGGVLLIPGLLVALVLIRVLASPDRPPLGGSE